MLLGVACFLSLGRVWPRALLRDHFRRAIRVDNVVVVAGPLVLGSGALNAEIIVPVVVGVFHVTSLACNGLFRAVVADQLAFERADEVDRSTVHAGEGQSHRVVDSHRGDFGVSTLVVRQVVKTGERILVTLAPSFVFEPREGSSRDLELSSGVIESVAMSSVVSPSVSTVVSSSVSSSTSTTAMQASASAWAAFVCVASKNKYIRGGLFFQGRGGGRSGGGSGSCGGGGGGCGRSYRRRRGRRRGGCRSAVLRPVGKPLVCP